MEKIPSPLSLSNRPVNDQSCPGRRAKGPAICGAGAEKFAGADTVETSDAGDGRTAGGTDGRKVACGVSQPPDLPPKEKQFEPNV